MCRKHLLGEHVELHMLVGTINKGRSIEGYVNNGLCEPHHIVSRHEELVEEMLRRGYNHNSPLNFEWIGEEIGDVNVAASILDLVERCPECTQALRAGGWVIEENTDE
jgi:hypothetical protein